MNTLNETAYVKNVIQANAAVLFLYAAQAVALFWSVFGPAARYNFGNPEYAYDALMKP